MRTLVLALILTITGLAAGVTRAAEPAHDHDHAATAAGEAVQHPEAAGVDAAHGELPGEHAAPHGKEHGSGGLLDPNPGLFIWQLILFLVFFAVLAKFVWPPILKGLRERELKQVGDLKAAEDAAKQAQATLAEYKKQLAEAQKQAQRIIDESRTAAQQVGAQVKAQAEKELLGMKDRAAADIRAAKEQAISEIYNQTAELATQIAGKILKRELTSADQQALVSESLSELSSVSRN